MGKRYLFRTALTLVMATLPSAARAAADLPAGATTWLAGTLVVVITGALAGLLVANRALRRELDRRGMEREQELNSRLRIEHKLQLVREELEHETETKRQELAGVQRQLDVARSQLEAAEERLDRLARVDDMTGLANRRRFDEALDQEIKRAIREQACLSIVLCEIDFFEEYARRRDAARTDTTLVKVTHAIEEVFRRAGDLVARYGDAKLAIILPATDQDAAMRFGERVRRTVWDLCIPHEASTAAERMTVSVGIATLLPTRLHKAGELLAATESALLQAHETGHNRVEHVLLSDRRELPAEPGSGLLRHG